MFKVTVELDHCYKQIENIKNMFEIQCLTLFIRYTFIIAWQIDAFPLRKKKFHYKFNLEKMHEKSPEGNDILNFLQADHRSLDLLRPPKF